LPGETAAAAETQQTQMSIYVTSLLHHKNIKEKWEKNPLYNSGNNTDFSTWILWVSLMARHKHA